MNLLLINHYAGTPALGMEYRPYYLAREWVRLGHEVMIIASAQSHYRARQPEPGQAVIDGMRDPKIVALPQDIRQLVLFDRSTNAQDLGSLLVANPAGDVIIDSHAVPPRHIHVGDRDYFQVHQGSPDVGLYISEPFKPRINGVDASLGLSRRLNGPHGEFKGIVVGTLRLNYFRRLFDGINLGPHATVTLSSVSRAASG
mgnify:CR=1 FL=1